MIGTNNDVNFFNNKTPYGQTISAFFSEILTKRMYFKQNKGAQGGVYNLDSTSVLDDEESVYEKN